MDTQEISRLQHVECIYRHLVNTLMLTKLPKKDGSTLWTLANYALLISKDPEEARIVPARMLVDNGTGPQQQPGKSLEREKSITTTVDDNGKWDEWIRSKTEAVVREQLGERKRTRSPTPFSLAKEISSPISQAQTTEGKAQALNSHRERLPQRLENETEGRTISKLLCEEQLCADIITLQVELAQTREELADALQVLNSLPSKRSLTEFQHDVDILQSKVLTEIVSREAIQTQRDKSTVSKKDFDKACGVVSQLHRKLECCCGKGKQVNRVVKLCGHVLCEDCVDRIIEQRMKLCPLCNQRGIVTKDDVLALHLK
eukprot:PhF_6_TR34728/c0_g1_i1/m.50531